MPPKKTTKAAKPKGERKRTQPGDFERQVAQIRADIGQVRNNLKIAEDALVAAGANKLDDEMEEILKTVPQAEQDDEILANLPSASDLHEQNL